MYIDEAHFNDFLKAKEILWLGIDFAKAKFTRDGFDYSQEIMRYYFNEWNMLIISDQKKYDIRLSFRKPIMSYDLSIITQNNKSVKIGNLICDHINIAHVYSDDAIGDYVKKLPLPKTHRYALLFVVESFDANSKTAAIWVTLIHTENNTPVLCEKIVKTSGGFGTKNYWEKKVYNMLSGMYECSFFRWGSMVSTNLEFYRS